MHARDVGQRQRHAGFLSQAFFDRQRLLIISQRIVRLAELFVSSSAGIEDRGFAVLIVELHSQSKRAVQIIERTLWIGAADFHASRGQQCVDVFWIRRQYFAQFRASFVVCADRFIEPAQGRMNVDIIRRSFRQILVRLDSFLVVVRHLRKVGLDHVSFLSRQLVAQVHSFPGKLFRLFVVTQPAVGLPQFGIRQCELRILLNRSGEHLRGFQVISLPHQLQPFVVKSQRLQRMRRGLK